MFRKLRLVPAVTVCRQQHTRRVAQLEQLLQARAAELPSWQALVDRPPQAAASQDAQEVHSLRALLEAAESHYREQLEAETALLKRQHMLQVIQSYFAANSKVYACSKDSNMYSLTGNTHKPTGGLGFLSLSLEHSQLYIDEELHKESTLTSSMTQGCKAKLCIQPYTSVMSTAVCMQMGKVQASQHTKHGALQAAADSLQERSKLLHSQHQQWAWQLASLLHWKRQGALQLRRVLHSWARLSAASRSHLTPASRKHVARNCREASDIEGDSVVGACPGTYLTANWDMEEARCQARLGLEAGVDGICMVTDHYDRRLLGACFRGTHACQLVCTSHGPWFLCLACAALVPRAFFLGPHNMRLACMLRLQTLWRQRHEDMLQPV